MVFFDKEVNVMKSGKITFYLVLAVFGAVMILIGCEPAGNSASRRLPLPGDPIPMPSEGLKDNPPPDSIKLEMIIPKSKKLPADLPDRPVVKALKPDKDKPDTAGNYLLRRGDEIEISVQGLPDMTRRIPIRPDGWISYSHVNEIKAAGRTIAELQEDLQKRMSEFINDPRVTVIGISFIPDEVSVLGTVKTPGRYAIERGSTVLEALAKCGGVAYPKGDVDTPSSGSAPNLSAAYILRTESQKFDPVDLNRLLNEKDSSQNKTLNHRDVLYIPTAEENKVFVIGEVRRPRVLYFSKDISFIEAFTRAEGLSYFGKNRGVYLIRGSLAHPQVYRLNAWDIVRGKRRNFLLKPGDIVFVGPSGLTRWQRLIGQIVPSLSAALTADQVGQLR